MPWNSPASNPFCTGADLTWTRTGRTTVPGLYAAGDMVGNAGCGLGLAAWMGWRAGHAAAADAATAKGSADLASNPAIQAKMELLSSFMDRKIGCRPGRKPTSPLPQIMSDYANVGPYHVRSESLLKAGLGYLAQLREETNAGMKASCSHTSHAVRQKYSICSTALNASCAPLWNVRKPR